jgi:predicted phage tail protein
MVATQAVTTAVLAVAGSKVTSRLPPLTADPKTDAALKALAGVALVVASVWVKEGWGKSILIGVGVGLAVGAAGPLVPGLR